MADEELVKHFTDKNFSTYISKGVTLVDFFATWCAPCRMLTPIIEEVATHFKDKVQVGKLDIDADQKIAMEFQVTSVPTMILFKDGKEVNRFIGLRDFSSIKSFIEDVL